MSGSPGPLALGGGAEFTDGNTVDEVLLEHAGGDVLVLPTAAAFEHPARAVATAEAWFARLGGRAEGLDVLTRRDALDEANAARVRAARCIYLTGGSPMHLRSVLKDSPVWDAIVEAWLDGAALAGASAGAMVLTDPMVDPRGGAFMVGLGVLAPLAVIPHVDRWSDDKVHRTKVLAPATTPVVGIDERTAALREPDGGWRAVGAGRVVVWVGGEEADLRALP